MRRALEVSHTVNERMHFVTRLERGERMTDLCLEFGISRKNWAQDLVAVSGDRVGGA